MKRVVVLEGLPASGKTTICDMLRLKFGWDIQKQVYAVARIGARYGVKDWRAAMD